MCLRFQNCFLTLLFRFFPPLSFCLHHPCDHEGPYPERAYSYLKVSKGTTLGHRTKDPRAFALCCTRRMYLVPGKTSIQKSLGVVLYCAPAAAGKYFSRSRDVSGTSGVHWSSRLLQGLHVLPETWGNSGFVAKCKLSLEEQDAWQRETGRCWMCKAEELQKCTSVHFCNCWCFLPSLLLFILSSSASSSWTSSFYLDWTSQIPTR